MNSRFLNKTNGGMWQALSLITGLLITTGLVLFGSGCGSGSKEAGGQAKVARYHCPMHPTYVDDRPSDCPICGMRLVPIKDGATDTKAAEGSSVPGRTPIMVSPEKRQLIGLATVPVEKRELSTSLRTTATVVHDETRLARVAPRFAGWVRQLYVNYLGQAVEKGQPLFTVYSPELFTAENEYVFALNNLRRMSNSPAADKATAESLVTSARRRLELLQVGPEEIQELENAGKPGDELLIRSPVSGHVVSKNAVEGKSFMAGETLYEIADLKHLWLKTTVFEYELPLVRVGQKARVVFPYLGNKTFESEITFISPHIDPQTRRAEVRLEIENPDALIRPDMWAQVELQTAHEPVLAIPASAMIDTGTRQIAFVDAEENHLEPRELEIGLRTDEFVQVLKGLKEGERVVTRALFLIDSESQLKAAIAGMTGPAEHNH